MQLEFSSICPTFFAEDYSIEQTRWLDFSDRNDSFYLKTLVLMIAGLIITPWLYIWI